MRAKGKAHLLVTGVLLLAIFLSISLVIDDQFHLSDILYRGVIVSEVLPVANRANHAKRKDLLQQSKSVIPEWMETYFEWHRNQRANPDRSTKFLLVACHFGEVCHGLSDRFKVLPYYVMMANATRRVLLFHWEKPAALEEFLVPPPQETGGGLDWRVSAFPENNITINELRQNQLVFNGFCCNRTRGIRYDCFHELSTNKLWSNTRVLRVRPKGGRVTFGWMFQWGELAYKNDARPPLDEADVFKHVFRLLFQPSPSIDRAIRKEMDRMNLIPGQYAYAHVRAKSPVPLKAAMKRHGVIIENDLLKELDYNGNVSLPAYAEDYIAKVYENAIKSARNLLGKNDLPIYLVSDTREAMNSLMTNMSDERTELVASNWTTFPPHLDFDGSKGRDPRDCYPIFIELFIMSQARCASHGSGGYGFLPIKMAGINCTFQHRNSDGTINRLLSQNTSDVLNEVQIR